MRPHEKASPRPQKAFKNWFRDFVKLVIIQTTSFFAFLQLTGHTKILRKHWNLTDFIIFHIMSVLHVFRKCLQRWITGPPPRAAGLPAIPRRKQRLHAAATLLAPGVCVMVWEHLWRIFSFSIQREFSVSLFSLCARVCLHPQHVPHCALVAQSVWVETNTANLRAAVWRMRQCSWLHLQMACKWKRWLCLLFKGSAVWKCSAAQV